MDEGAIPGRGDGDELRQQLLAQHGAPAYVRRARRVQAAFDDLVERGRLRREEWLPMVRLRLGVLRALAGEWEALRPHVADDDQLHILRRLEAELQPRLRAPVTATTSPRALRGALRKLRESLERFNRRWQTYLAEIDPNEINQLREGYNRWYLVEKECAVFSARLARQTFRPLPPLTVEEIAAALPPLPVPQEREDGA